MKIYLVILIILSIAIVNAQDNEVVGRCMTGFNLNCAKCLWTQNADEYCLECAQGYSLDHGKCVKGSNIPPSNIQCPENCMECQYDMYNSVICTKCQENAGLYLTPENTCTSCPSQCEECSSIGGDLVFLTCSKCKAGVAFNNEVCAEQNIEGCNAYYIDESTNNVVCGGCETGYIMNGFSCNKCPSQCTSCYAPAIPIGFESPHINCGGCVDGSQPNNGVCGKCPNGCVNCQYSMDLQLSCISLTSPINVNPGGPIILVNSTNIGFLQ